MSISNRTQTSELYFMDRHDKRTEEEIHIESFSTCENIRVVISREYGTWPNVVALNNEKEILSTIEILQAIIAKYRKQL